MAHLHKASSLGVVFICLATAALASSNLGDAPPKRSELLSARLLLKRVPNPDLKGLVFDPDQQPVEYCTFDLNKGNFGPITMAWPGWHNTAVFDTCVFYTPGTDRDSGFVTIKSQGYTIEDYSDRHFTNPQNLILSDITVETKFFDQTYFPGGPEVEIADVQDGAFNRDCNATNNPTGLRTRHFHTGFTNTQQSMPVLKMASQWAEVDYWERGLDQC